MDRFVINDDADEAETGVQPTITHTATNQKKLVGYGAASMLWSILLPYLR